jgi:hypothetical protein
VRLDHGPQRQLLQVPELRLNERLLVTARQADMELIEGRLRARDALEAHVAQLWMHQVRDKVTFVRPGTLLDDDAWLETYRSLCSSLEQVERSIFAARGLVYPEP